MDVENSRHLKRDWPFYWVSRVNARYVQALDRRLKPLGIDVPRWRVLISLYEEKYLSITEISELATMRLNTTTKVVQRMILDGLVETRVRPTDGRATEVCLTERGDLLRAAALEEAQAILDMSFADVTKAERARLNIILSKVFLRLDRL